MTLTSCVLRVTGLRNGKLLARGVVFKGNDMFFSVFEESGRQEAGFKTRAEAGASESNLIVSRKNSRIALHARASWAFHSNK